MSRHRDRLGDIRLIVVTFTDPERLTAYRRHLELPDDVELVSDVDRVLYTSFGLRRGTRRQVWSLGTLRMYARLLRSGRRLQRPDGDIRQLGGDIVVDRSGRVAAVFRPSTPDSRPSVAVLARVTTSV